MSVIRRQQRPGMPPARASLCRPRENSRRRRLRCCAAGVVLFTCLGFYSPVAAQTPSDPVPPAWSWEPATAIEWTERVGGGKSLALLTATCNGRLHLLDPHTGRPCLTPISAQPGVRLARGSAADTTDNTVYCFDRFAVYAVQLPPSAGLRWQAGSWRAGLGADVDSQRDPQSTFQGDPEELTRIAAAHATAAGVLVARDDGCGGLLDRLSGQVRWNLRLPPLPLAHLHVCGNTGGLIWKDGPRVSAALIDLCNGRQRPIRLPDETTWPIWTTLTDLGLVLVHPNRISLWDPARPPRSYRVDGSPGILGPAVTLHADVPRANEDQTETVLFFGTGDRQLHALDLRSGKTRWTVTDQTSSPAYWARLDVQGDILTAMASHTATLRSIRTGERLAAFDAGPNARLLRVDLGAGTAWLLWADGPAHQAQLHLTRLKLPGGADARQERSQRTYSLGSTGVFLSAVRLDDRLIVATRAGLRAYPLQ